MFYKKSSIIFILAAVFICSCADTRQDTFAEVQGHFLSTETVVNAYLSEAETQSVKNVRREDLLHFVNDRFINGLLLRVAGYEHKLDESAEVRQTLKNSKKHLLIRRNGVLFQSIVPAAIEVNDAEIEQYYTLLGFEIITEDIRVHSMSLADSLYRLIKEGQNIKELAIKYSASASNPGYFGYGQRNPLYEKIAFDLQTGEVSRPVAMQDGFYIISLIERRTRPLPPLDTIRDSLAIAVRQKKQTLFFNSYLEGLTDKYSVQFHNANLARFVNSAVIQNGQRYIALQKLGDTAEQPAIHSAAGEMSIREVAEYYNQLPAQLRYPIRYLADAQALAKAAHREDLLYHDALQRGLDKHPRFDAAIQHICDSLVEHQYFEEFIAPKITVSQADIEGHYGEYYDTFKTMPRQTAFENIRAKLLREKTEQMISATAAELKKQFIIRYNSLAIVRALKALNEMNQTALRRPGSRRTDGE